MVTIRLFLVFSYLFNLIINPKESIHQAKTIFRNSKVMVINKKKY